MRWASSASRRAPHSRWRLARIIGAFVGQATTPPSPATRPMWTCGSLKRTPRADTIASAHSTMLVPSPYTSPATAATNGFG